MVRRPPISTRTDTRFPYMTLFRSTFDGILRKLHDSWNHEYRFRAAQGNFINLYSRGYVVRDDEGQAVRSIGALLDVTAARRAEGELRWAANHDPLTGLPNRKLFAEVLEQALTAASANASCVCVIVIDVDGFKLLDRKSTRLNSSH